MCRDPFKVRRFPLSYADVRDLLAERGIDVDWSTLYRWVQKFGPEIARRAHKHGSWRGLNWHVDETDVRVDGPLLSYERGGSYARLELPPGIIFMPGGGGGRTVPLLVIVDRL